MQKNFTISLFALAAAFYIFTFSVPEPNNPPLGNTGAPGETTCAQRDCHGGGTFTGSVTLQGLPDTVVANTLYEVSVRIQSDSAMRTGFQLTVLDDQNNFVGKMATIPNERVNIASSNNPRRTYARQSQAKFFDTAGLAIWKFNWTAPASVPNDSLIFYYASCLANGDGARTKDNSINFKRSFKFRLAVANENIEKELNQVGLFVQSNQLVFVGNRFGTIHQVNVRSLNGAHIIQPESVDHQRYFIGKLPSGMYIVDFKIDQHQLTRKIFIH